MIDKPIIAANWKMNLKKDDSIKLIDNLNNSYGEGANVIILPPFTLLDSIKSKLGNNIALGAQNCYYKNYGAYTGEISPIQLIDIGCKYVIIGHSERRHIFGEDNKFLSKKLTAARKAGLIPIYCIGETLEERETGKKEPVLSMQINILRKELMPFIVAYEPIWAIGTGKIADIKTIEQTHSFIRDKLSGQMADVPIIYGGSVKPENTYEIASCDRIDGVLVGGASLNANQFIKIINIFKEVKTC